MKAYRSLGLTMLENEHVVIHRGEASLAIVGITDTQARRFGQREPDFSAALKGAKPGTPVILLSNRPGGAIPNAQAGVALQFSGHPRAEERRAGEGCGTPCRSRCTPEP